MWIARLFSIALCLAGIDSFIATAHGELPALIAAGLGAVLSAGSLVLFWKRPSIAAALSLLWLAAAFAAAAILLGSADVAGAIGFTGLTPGDAAAIVISLVLAAAAAIGFGMARVAGARIVVAVAALYALAPLLASIGHGGLRAALTEGVLSNLRGAYIGIEALLPLAALAAAGAACFFLTRRRGMAAATAFFLACAMVATNQLGAYSIAQAGLPGFVAFDRTGAASEKNIVSTSSPEETADVLGQYAASMPPEQYDIETRAKSLPTLDAAFAYVRDSIGFESYSGILRGAHGTFFTGAGNAIDRSMLLAYFLATDNIPVRYVTGRLAPAQAEVLFTRIFDTKPNPATLKPGSSFGPADALGANIFNRGDRDFAIMRNALGSTQRTTQMTSHDDAIKEMTSHAWLQAEVNGQWTDLDTSFPDATVGHAYAAVEQTSTEVPAALMQHVTIRDTAEMLKNGRLEQHVVFDQTFPAYKLLDRQIFLAHVQFQGTEAMFRSKDTFRPMLIVDGQDYVGDGISFSAGDAAAAATNGDAIDDANAALRAGLPAEPSTAAQFVAERLEFVIDFPDGHSDSTGRMLVDRASTAWRHSGKFDAATLRELPRNKDGLLAPQAIYNLCFSGGKHDLPAYAQSMQMILRGQGIRSESSPGEEPTFNEQAWPLAMSDFAYFLVSDHVIVPALNDTPGIRFYADSPRIFIFGYTPDTDGTATDAFVTTDLRRDVVRAVVRDATALDSVAQHKLRFAALEGALEDQLGRANLAPSNESGVSTSSLAATGGVAVFRPDASAATAARDPETAARMQVALASGNTLIVPDRVLAGGVSGWWEVSSTGEARAVLDDDLNGWEYKSPGNGLGSGRPGGVNNVNWDTYSGRSAKLPGEPVVPPTSKTAKGGELGAYATLVKYIAMVARNPFFQFAAAAAGIAGAGAAVALAMRH